MAQGSIGSLLVSLSADIAGFQSDLGKAVHIAQANALAIQRALSGARDVLVGLGAAISVGAIVNSYKQIIDAAEQVNKSAQKFGTTAESFSSLAYAAKTTGVDVQGLDGAMSKLSDKMADAAGGGKQSEAIFKSMGISVQNAGGQLKGTDEILREIAEKFASYKDGAGKAALATDLFGKSGTALIPMLNNLKAAEEEGKRLGAIFGTDLSKASAEFNDNLGRLNTTMQASKIILLQEMLPALNKYTQELLAASQVAGGFWKGLALFATTGGSSDPVKRLGEISTTLQKLKGTRAELMQNSSLAGQMLAGVPFFGTDSDVADINKQIRLLEMQREVLTRVATGQGDKDNFDLMGTIKKNAPIVPKDAAGAEAAARARQKVLDDAVKIELESVKDLAQQRTAILDALHNDNLIGEKEYWSTKAMIAKEALDAEIKVIDDQISRQKDVLGKQKSGTKEYADAQGNLQESLAKRNKLEADFQQQSVLSYYAATRGSEQYRRSVEDINIQIQELKGNLVDAATRRQELADADSRKKYKDDQPALDLLDERKRLIVSQAEFTKEREKQGEVTARLAIEEERIQNSRRTGAISEIEALRQTGMARAKAGAELTPIIERMKEIALLAENPQLRLQAEQAAAALEQLRTQTDLVGEKYGTIFKDSLADAFTDFATGAKSAKEAFTDFANSVVRQLIRMQAEATANNIWNLINGKPAAGGASGGGGGGIGGLFSGLFGGGGGAAAGGAGLAEVGGSMLLGGFATGTDYVPRTGPYMLHEGEKVIPPGGGDVNVHLTVQSLDPRTAAAVLVQNEPLILGMFRRAYNQRGVATPIG